MSAKPPIDRPTNPTADPGGAHSNGYGADPEPNTPPLPDPIPVANTGPGRIHVPERDPWVRPTGKAEPQPYNPDERVIDSGE